MNRREWARLGVMVGGMALWGLAQGGQVPVSITEVDDQINFSMADEDKSGTVSREELDRRRDAALEVFAQSDADLDDQLSGREYASARETLRNHSPG